MTARLWDVLIATIPHRHELLCGLLAELDRQHLPGTGVLLYRDNLEHTIAAKRQALLRTSSAEYTCFVDDDDMVPPWYSARVLQALQERPDYVGFRVSWLVDGEDQWLPIEHSLRFPGWSESAAGLRRDISHLNPIRRELALLGRFEGGAYSEDSRWAAAVRATGRVREEAWISAVMYWYRFRTADNAGMSREPFPGPLPELPSYPWLEVL